MFMYACARVRYDVYMLVCECVCGKMNRSYQRKMFRYNPLLACWLGHHTIRIYMCVYMRNNSTLHNRNNLRITHIYTYTQTQCVYNTLHIKNQKNPI